MQLFRYICFALIISSLAGCAPAAFVAGVATGSVVSADRRTLKAIADDQTITQEIKLAWQNDQNLAKKTHLNVASYNGIVLLVGQTPTKSDLHQAYQLATKAPHVKRIYNQIQIMGQTSVITRSSDSWITTKVKSQLIARHGVPGTHIKVITENGVVYLMGILKPNQGQRAAAVARKVAGVQKVVKLFEYDRAIS